MIRPSLIHQVALPLLAGTLVAAFLLLVVVPERQERALESTVQSELDSLAAAFAVSAHLAFAQQDLSALADLNQLIREDERALMVAVLVNGPDGEQVLAEFPHEGRVLPIIREPSANYLLASAALSSEFDEGRIVLLYDREQLNQQMARLRLPLYAALAAIVLIQLLVYWRLARQVVRPIIESATFAEQLGAGQYGAKPAPVTRSDEVGLLLGALRRLRTRLLLQRRQNTRLLSSLESEVARRTEQLERALDAKDTFMASISHELRTPLHSIIASLDLMHADEAMPVSQQRNLKLANRGSKTLLRLINELLDFQRFSKTEIVFLPEPTALKEQLQDITEVASALFEDSPLDFFVDSDLPSNLWVELDAHRLSQVLLNLIGNARKFTVEGEVLLRASLGVTDEQTVAVEFEVSDTGPGMDAATLARLGDAFFQADEGLNRRHAGTGLGISIVQRILTGMGSALSVSSNVGVGSQFAFTLTLNRCDPPASAVASVPQDGSAAPSAIGIILPPEVSSLNVLYVEDSEMNRMVMSALCEKLPITLQLADGAQTGYQMIRSSRFDLIISDIQMPEYSGVDLLDWIKDDPGANDGTPVLACTANASCEACEKFLQSGFDGILTKPLRLAELTAAINEINRKASIASNRVFG